MRKKLIMDGDLLSPKRKRTGRACSLKKSNANCQITSSATHDRTNSTGPVDFQDESRSKGTESSVVSVYSIHEDSLLLDDSPLKAQRCSGPTIDNQRNGQKMNKFLSTPALNVVGVDRKKGGDQDQMFCPEYSKSTPPRSPPSLTHSQEDTTTDSISDAKKFDDTTVQSLDSPHSSSFFREAASERKRDDGAEEFDSVLHLDGSLFDKYEEHAIRTSQYSPRVPFRKGCNYGSYCESSSSSSSSSSSANKLRTASRHPIFTCPGSADLRHNQQVDDEWRSSFEAEDGESDEEEKSSNCSNAIVDNMPMKLKFRTRPLFAPDSSKSRLFQDDNDHQVMDNNMSSMALHVGKDSWKGHTKSIFDCDPVHPNDCHPKFLFRVGSKGSNLISDSSTSFMDALTTDGSDDGEVGRQSFSAEMRTPFQLEKGREIRGPEMSNFERILTGDIDDWQSSPVSIPSRDKGRFNLFSSSFSPSGNLHTPARLAGTAAASMGDLGTPVTEAGSPADIDMGASYEPYVEGDEEESGIFAYVTKPHIQDADIFPKSKAKRTTNTPNSACNVMENNGRDRTRPTYNAVDNVIDKSCRQNSSDCVIQVRNTEGDDITRLENNKSGSTDKDCTNLEVVLRPGSFDSPLVDGVPINFSMLSPRIRPDQSAFERGTGSLGGIGSVDCPSTPMRHVLNCPATPLRTPSWAERVTSYISDEDTDKLLEREGDNHITRQNSLTANRVLLSLSDTLDSDDVSFHRDFEQEGFLGSGTFADVYRARERDGKSYAVKKSKRQFRSKKDRNILMGEVMIMKKLGVAPCQHIVQLVRAWQEDGYFFVQIDLAERGTLKDLLTDLALQNSQPEDATVWHILHDVAAGLQHIHNCGVVHLGERVSLTARLPSRSVSSSS